MMPLDALARACGARLHGDGSAVVASITHQAHSASAGTVFAAVPGRHHHGIDFLADAVAAGAAAVLSDRDPGPALPWLETATPRHAMALAAWALAGWPQRRLRLVGITGTNGKTTVADLIARIARAAGERPGVFGTIAYSLPERSVDAVRTTPEATDLAPLLGELVTQGGTIAVMEVASIALTQERVSGLEFDVAVWTNLTRDHLDLHGDMENYLAAKASLAGLLRRDPPGRRVIGIDDAMIRRLAAQPRPGDLTFGTGDDALVRAVDVRASLAGTVFSLVTPAGSVAVSLPLIGRHNLENALAAAAASLALGWNLETIATALGAAAPVAGRLEPVDIGRPCQVFVDYAHTPDALEQVLRAIRELAPERRLIVVFGCGGDKDTGKRAPMGEIVARIADVPIVTSDNPRSEDPQAIIDEVLTGVQRVGNPRLLAIADRREAIAAALAVADDHSVIILAGKGHEREQIFADHTVPFDDRVVVRELARRRRG